MTRVSLIAAGLLLTGLQASPLNHAFAQEREAEPLPLLNATQQTHVQELMEEIEKLRQENVELRTQIQRLDPELSFRGKDNGFESSFVQLEPSIVVRADSKTLAPEVQVLMERAARKNLAKAQDLTGEFHRMEGVYKDQIKTLEDRADALESKIQKAMGLEGKVRKAVQLNKGSQSWVAISGEEEPVQVDSTGRVRWLTTKGQPLAEEAEPNPFEPGQIWKVDLQDADAQSQPVVELWAKSSKSKDPVKAPKKGSHSGMVIYTQGGKVIFQNSAPCEQCQKQSKAQNPFQPGHIRLNSQGKKSVSKATTDPDTPNVFHLSFAQPEAPSEPSMDSIREAAPVQKFLVNSLMAVEPVTAALDSLAGNDALVAEIKDLLAQMQVDMDNLATNLSTIQSAMDHAHKTGSHQGSAQPETPK